MNELDNYAFIIYSTKSAKDFLNDYYKESFYSTDGSPFLSKKFYEGYLLSKVEYYPISSEPGISIYKINDRFIDKEDFISSYLDGDVEDDDFIECI